MARKPNSTDSKLPTHDLVVKFTQGNQEIILGRIGLFTDNNDLHEFIANLSEEKIKTIAAKLSFELAEHGSTRNKREFTADW